MCLMPGAGNILVPPSGIFSRSLSLDFLNRRFAHGGSVILIYLFLLVTFHSPLSRFAEKASSYAPYFKFLLVLHFAIACLEMVLSQWSTGLMCVSACTRPSLLTSAFVISVSSSTICSPLLFGFQTQRHHARHCRLHVGSLPVRLCHFTAAVLHHDDGIQSVLVRGTLVFIASSHILIL